jgi:hypothetical protein
MHTAGLPESDEYFNFKRIGTPVSARSRPLEVSFNSKSRAFELISKSKNLKVIISMVMFLLSLN